MKGVIERKVSYRVECARCGTGLHIVTRNKKTMQSKLYGLLWSHKKDGWMCEVCTAKELIKEGDDTDATTRLGS